jgi:hypothetical protein
VGDAITLARRVCFDITGLPPTPAEVDAFIKDASSEAYEKLVDRLIASPLVDRLNVGSIATNVISWDQPHEGNLFEHLYARRSFQVAVAL